MRGAVVVLLLLLAVVAAPYRQWRNIFQKVSREPEFSGFFNSMIREHRVAKLNLNYAAVTVFVPENRAVDAFAGEFTDDLVLYHMSFQVGVLEVLGRNASMATAHADNPPLWITANDGRYHVNNARILEERSNYAARSQGDQTKSQVLHVIDQVLDPMVHSPYPNATAYSFLQHHYKWKIGRNTVREFLHRVRLHSKEELYRRPGGHTFFVPVDHRMDDYQLETIDEYVIEGHVVPNVVLFTRPTQSNFIHETAANGDYIYIVLSMNTTAGRSYVRSYTVLGNSAHRKGEVVAEIVRGDIPVANGVVHLIQRPLAVFKRELKPFPYLPVSYKISADPDLSHVHELGERAGLGVLLRNESLSVTYFAPRNRAWRPFLRSDPDRMADILGRHVVLSDGRVTMARLARLAAAGGTAALDTLSGRIELAVEENRSHLVWNGRRVAVYRADYECTNGVVHVIDGVFADGEAPPPGPPISGGFWKTLKELVA